MSALSRNPGVFMGNFNESLGIPRAYVKGHLVMAAFLGNPGLFLGKSQEFLGIPRAIWQWLDIIW